MEEKAVVEDKRLGDEESNLLDQFERMSLEAHLRRAMLGRSLRVSEPEPLAAQGKQRRRGGSRFHSVLKKLLNPVLGMNIKRTGSREQVADLKHPLSLKVFTRSLRF